MSSRIPKANAPGALHVSDGADACGTIVERDGSFFTFDIDGVLVGEYPSQREAVRACPPALVTSKRCKHGVGLGPGIRDKVWNKIAPDDATLCGDCVAARFLKVGRRLTFASLRPGTWNMEGSPSCFDLFWDERTKNLDEWLATVVKEQRGLLPTLKLLSDEWSRYAKNHADWISDDIPRLRALIKKFARLGVTNDEADVLSRKIDAAYKKYKKVLRSCK
jgi:hypothetical protein